MSALHNHKTRKSNRNSNNNGEIDTPKSSEDDENNSEESSSNDTNLVDSSNNHLIKWTAEDLVAIDDSEEKIYEDLCYVTISSSAFPSEVFIEKYFAVLSNLFPARRERKKGFRLARGVFVQLFCLAIEIEVAYCSH